MKTPEEFISKLTMGKPLDASDVNSFSSAKAEIQAIRKYAQQFLDNMAIAGDNDDDDGTSEEAIDKDARGALYDKQDFSSFKKESIPKSREVKALIHDAIKPNVLFENDYEDELVELIDLFKPVNVKKVSICALWLIISSYNITRLASNITHTVHDVIGGVHHQARRTR